MEFKTKEGTVITDETFDEMAKEYKEGTWSGHGEVIMGRPRLYDEDMETVPSVFLYQESKLSRL